VTDRRCETCCWWDQGGARLASAAVDPGAKPDVGVCCVDPPRLMQVTEYWSEGVFPSTHASRFCAEWQPEIDPGGGGEQQPVQPDNVVSFDRSVA
jgi:hypothetical protein